MWRSALSPKMGRKPLRKDGEMRSARNAEIVGCRRTAGVMRVAAYTHLHRALNPTGVGHHTIQMVRGLHGTPGVQLTVIAPQNQLDRAGRIPNRNALAGIPARGLPLDRRWLERLWERLDAPKADRWCENPDSIYTPTEAYVATRRARFAVTVHDLHAFEPGLPWSNTSSHRSLQRRWTAMFRPIVRRADRILAASEFTRRRLVELLGARDDRITIVGNGVDQAFFAASAENQIAHAIRRNIVVIGGLTRRKGGDLVLRVARELRRHLPDLRVVVAGAGEKEFDVAATELNNIVCLGFVPEAELVRLLQGALAMM